MTYFFYNGVLTVKPAESKIMLPGQKPVDPNARAQMTYTGIWRAKSDVIDPVEVVKTIKLPDVEIIGFTLQDFFEISKAQYLVLKPKKEVDPVRNR